MQITIRQYLNEPSFGLTARQKDMVELVCKGWSNAEIATATFCTERAVKLQLTKIYKAMDVKSRAQLIVRCLPYLSTEPAGPIATKQPDGLYKVDQQKANESMIQSLARAEQEFQANQREKAVLQQADHNPGPTSMYVMGMCSDVQELLSRGMLAEANQVLNDIKLVIDRRMATKDEHGRHDYAPGEMNRRTQAKLEYLASQRETVTK